MQYSGSIMLINLNPTRSFVDLDHHLKLMPSKRMLFIVGEPGEESDHRVLVPNVHVVVYSPVYLTYLHHETQSGDMLYHMHQRPVLFIRCRKSETRSAGCQR